MPELFNQQKKEAFLASTYTNEVQSRQCRYYLARLAPFEIDWDADFSTFDEARLKQALEELAGVRDQSQNMMFHYLRRYVEWCKASGDPDVSDAIFHVKVDGLEKIRQRTVSSPEHLQQYLDAVYEPESEKTVDVTYRAYFWLAFAGMKEEDIIKVRCTDVDLDGMVIRYNGEEYPIYEQAVMTLQIASRLPVFKYRHPNYKSDIYRDRIAGDTLVRSFRDVRNVVTYRNSLSKAIHEALKDGRTTIRLSYSRTWLSGLFWRAYECEKAGGTVDFRQEAEQFTERRRDAQNQPIPYALGDSRLTLEHKRRDVMRDYMADYKRWKRAWNLT